MRPPMCGMGTILGADSTEDRCLDRGASAPLLVCPPSLIESLRAEHRPTGLPWLPPEEDSSLPAVLLPGLLLLQLIDQRLHLANLFALGLDNLVRERANPRIGDLGTLAG